MTTYKGVQEFELVRFEVLLWVMHAKNILIDYLQVKALHLAAVRLVTRWNFKEDFMTLRILG
jgi:hypothetical protein